MVEGEVRGRQQRLDSRGWILDKRGALFTPFGRRTDSLVLSRAFGRKFLTLQVHPVVFSGGGYALKE